MTYVKTDPSSMTPDERADYQRRSGTPDEPTADAGERQVTVPVTFDDNEIARVKQTSKAAGEDVAAFVHDAALHEADGYTDRHTT